MASSYRYRLLQIALVVFGVVFLLVYPLAVAWPSGWAWHPGAPYQSDYFAMIVGVYATLGVFFLVAIVLSVLVSSSGLKQPPAGPQPLQPPPATGAPVIP